MQDGASDRLLVIHRDRELGSAIGQTLARSGFATEIVADGIDGLLAARRLEPTVVLCDATAPRLSAIDLCRTIRHEPGLATAFVIVLASDPAGVDQGAVLDAGADGVLAGVLDVKAIVATVRAGLRARDAARAEASARQNEATRERAASFVADVNNALMALVGHLSLVRSYLDQSETERANGHVEDARRAAERIAAATRGFLVACERMAPTAEHTAASDSRPVGVTADRA